MADRDQPGPKAPAAKASGQADVLSLLGLGVSLAAIMGGLLLEGGRLRDVVQFTAALIVLGGTMGAVMVSTPGPVLRGALRRFAGVFRGSPPDMHAAIAEVIQYATKARKSGLVSLEEDAEVIPDPFLKKALMLAVDGTDLQELRGMLELEMDVEERRAEAEAKVFEAAGGFAPTVGIIGAVLGLIQVMQHLANIDEVGHGIAVAFVATIYGVATANLLFLPVAAKIKARAHAASQRQELILEATCGIVEGLNPKLLAVKLEAYARGAPPKQAKPAKAGVKRGGAPAGAKNDAAEQPAQAGA
jgi:chemotaxis protein MotA